MGGQQDRRRYLSWPVRLATVLLVAAVASWGLVGVSGSAVADVDCGPVECKGKKKKKLPPGDPPRAPRKGDTYPDVYKTPACSINHAPPNDPGAMCMGATNSCPNDEAIRMRIFTRQMRYDGTDWKPVGNWEFLDNRCVTYDDPDPQVTGEMVLTEIKQYGLPAGRVEVNPANARTLVAFPTIFYTERGPYQTQLTILGQTVRIKAAPTSYTWHWGDGETSSTQGPGAPWPRGHLAHAYDEAGSFAVRVDVHYHIRWDAGDGWQDIDQVVTSDGPATPVTAVEKVSVLQDG